MNPQRTPNLIHRDGELYYFPDFLAQDEAWTAFDRLRTSLTWREEEIVLYGRKVTVPRLVCWYGEPQAVYRYSGIAHTPLPWTAELLAMKQHIEQKCGWFFNSVLGNLYRDGRDSMGWHADNERELGTNPRIASLSLGEARIFRLRHRDGESLELMLQNGSLLLMGGCLQHHWRHCLPKTRRCIGARINLTFRYIHSNDTPHAGGM